MRSPSLKMSPPNSPNPNPLILTSRTLILTFLIIIRTENNISLTLEKLTHENAIEKSPKMEINKIILDEFYLCFLW